MSSSSNDAYQRNYAPSFIGNKLEAASREANQKLKEAHERLGVRADEVGGSSREAELREKRRRERILNESGDLKTAAQALLSTLVERERRKGEENEETRQQMDRLSEFAFSLAPELRTGLQEQMATLFRTVQSLSGDYNKAQETIAANNLLLKGYEVQQQASNNGNAVSAQLSQEMARLTEEIKNTLNERDSSRTEETVSPSTRLLDLSMQLMTSKTERAAVQTSTNLDLRELKRQVENLTEQKEDLRQKIRDANRERDEKNPAAYIRKRGSTETSK